jgi:hypothetical protein
MNVLRVHGIVSSDFNLGRVDVPSDSQDIFSGVLVGVFDGAGFLAGEAWVRFWFDF